MASTVGICNRGLSYIGLESINALTEDSAAARACNTHYDEERLILLEGFPYEWATGRQALAKFATNDRPDEWEFKYQRPSGVLTMRWVQDRAVIRAAREGHRVASEPYKLAEGAIYTDLDDAWAEWNNDETDPNQFPPTFREALSWAIAKTAAIAITEVADRLSFAQSGYVAAKERAEMLALAESDQKNVVVADWLRARGYQVVDSGPERYATFGAGPH